tara:strand:- start:227 stop:733 length:507 start_codon:yes stop_codon:yes gene_type:complete
MKILFTTIIIISLLKFFSLANANDNTSDINDDQRIIIAQNSVTPEEEVKQAAEMEATGPRKTIGISSVRILSIVPLDGEFERAQDRVLRGREIDIEPGGKVAVHYHKGRPGIAYIVKGQLTEHRVGADGPAVKKVGDAVWEKTGTIHWWENEGDSVARVIVIDLVPPE